MAQTRYRVLCYLELSSNVPVHTSNSGRIFLLIVFGPKQLLEVTKHYVLLLMILLVYVVHIF